MKRCLDCIHFDPIYGFDHPYADTSAGWCRRRAPVIATRKYSNGDTHEIAVYPHIKEATHWCGEFSDRESTWNRLRRFIDKLDERER